MSTQRSFDPEDLPLYAMQLLSSEDAATIRVHLEHNPTNRQEVAEIQGVLAAVAFSAEMHSPSPKARTRFLKLVAQEKRAVPAKAAGIQAIERPVLERPVAEMRNVDGLANDGVRRAEEKPEVAAGAEIPVGPPAAAPSTPSFASIGGYHRGEGQVLDFEHEAARRGLAARVAPWLGWAVAAGLALSTGNLYQKSEGLKRAYATDQAQLARTTADANTARDVMNAMTDETATRVTLTRQGALLTPTGRTVYSAEKGVLIFTATNMEPVQSFKVYELWLIPANGGKPIPAGTFRPDAKGAASMISTTMPKGVDAKAFGITLEEDGGAKTPTLPILMTGA